MRDLLKAQPGSLERQPGLARFVHQLTHDVRNDLAAVEVFATAAAGSGDAALVCDALAEISAMVAACGRRLAALRAEACFEAPTPQMVQMSVAGWLDGIRKHVERHPAAPFVVWRWVEAASGVMRSDPALLAAILDELLANALRCGGAASRVPVIEINLLLSPSWMSIEVRQRVVESIALADLAALDLKTLDVPALSATKHHYGFGLSSAALRARAIGADLSAVFEPSHAEETWFTAVLKLPLMS